MKDLKYEEPEANTQVIPQGGVISPLLSNIALHGMERHVVNFFGRDKVKLIRYAGDFVVMGKNLKDILKAKKLVEEFLQPIGLKLSESKTRIGHTMEKIQGMEGPIGLDFLSFHFRNLPRSKHRGVKSTRGATQKFVQVSKPTRQAVKNHKGNLRLVLKTLKSAPLSVVIQTLGLKIRG